MRIVCGPSLVLRIAVVSMLLGFLAGFLVGTARPLSAPPPGGLGSPANQSLSVPTGTDPIPRKEVTSWSRTSSSFWSAGC